MDEEGGSSGVACEGPSRVLVVHRVVVVVVVVLRESPPPPVGEEGWRGRGGALGMAEETGKKSNGVVGPSRRNAPEEGEGRLGLPRLSTPLSPRRPTLEPGLESASDRGTMGRGSGRRMPPAARLTEVGRGEMAVLRGSSFSLPPTWSTPPISSWRLSSSSPSPPAGFPMPVLVGGMG